MNKNLQNHIKQICKLVVFQNDSQERLRNSICEFFKAHLDKGKAFVVQSFKNLITNEILSRSGMFKILKKYEE